MKKSILMLIPVIVFGCGDEENSADNISQDVFVRELSKTLCSYEYLCCEKSERSPGYSTEAECIVGMNKSWSVVKLYDNEIWNGTNGYSVISEFKGMLKSCERWNKMRFVFQKYPLTNPKKSAGDKCIGNWDCTTKYCLNSVCANRAKAGESCPSPNDTEGCIDNMVCMSDKKCRTLLGDGAQCAQNYECDSFACASNKCIRTSTYECDGK